MHLHVAMLGEKL